MTKSTWEQERDEEDTWLAYPRDLTAQCGIEAQMLRRARIREKQIEVQLANALESNVEYDRRHNKDIEREIRLNRICANLTIEKEDLKQQLTETNTEIQRLKDELISHPRIKITRSKAKDITIFEDDE